MSTCLVLRRQSPEAALREQASLLDLTHNPVSSRGLDVAITYSFTVPTTVEAHA
jgi:hypothetical protein